MHVHPLYIISCLLFQHNLIIYYLIMWIAHAYVIAPPLHVQKLVYKSTALACGVSLWARSFITCKQLATVRNVGEIGICSSLLVCSCGLDNRRREWYGGLRFGRLPGDFEQRVVYVSIKLIVMMNLRVWNWFLYSSGPWMLSQDRYRTQRLDHTALYWLERKRCIDCRLGHLHGQRPRIQVSLMLSW